MVAATSNGEEIPDDRALVTTAHAPAKVQSITDLLSRLPNRLLGRERIEQIFRRPRDQAASVGLLLINIDALGLINEMHGDDAGELVLKTVAVRLAGLLRPSDTLTRYSGNEFVMLCDPVQNPQALTFLATRINDAIQQKIDYQGVTLGVTASIGIVVGDGKSSAEEMLSHATAATQAAKAAGRNCWQFFDERLHEGARRRRQLTAGLLKSVEREELSTRFQPIVAAETGRIVGAELLLRWHPADGAVPPNEFIPIAETTGSIVPIGRWVFRKACEAEAAWRHRWGAKAPYVSVNISVRQLAEEPVVEEFATILRETGAKPSSVLLEVTESLLMTDVEANLRVLRRMTDLGLRLAVW
jgi:diguanylate cyclase (GGDEF)-like protein